jgi:hypothetical protein
VDVLLLQLVNEENDVIGYWIADNLFHYWVAADVNIFCNFGYKIVLKPLLVIMQNFFSIQVAGYILLFFQKQILNILLFTFICLTVNFIYVVIDEGLLTFNLILNSSDQKEELFKKC